MAKKASKKRVGKNQKALKRKKSVSKIGKANTPDLFENMHRTRIRVVGIGGGGGSIVAEVALRVQRLDFIAANTDHQALRDLPRKVKTFPFGQDFTHGLGCGMDPELGERAAKAEKEKIKKMLEGTDICIFVSSLGGGTGSGSSSVFAEVAYELRILTIGIFTMPFSFEGDKRRQVADTSLEKVKPFLNTYVVIPNENIFRVVDSKTPLKASFSAVNKKLTSTLEGFIDTLSSAGLINIDFADVRSVLEGRGRLGFINSAEGSGHTKAQDVAKAVLQNPLYDYGISGADRILFNIVGDRNLKMQEAAQISNVISEHNTKARIIFGISCNNAKLKDKVRVTLFAVGCGTLDADSPKKAELKQKRKVIKQKSGKILVKRIQKDLEKSNDTKKDGISFSEDGDVVEELKVRRSAMEVKNAVDEELQELEKKEREWDVPAFLRNK